MKLKLPLSLLALILSTHAPLSAAENAIDAHRDEDVIWNDLDATKYDRLVLQTPFITPRTITINASLDFNGYILDAKNSHTFGSTKGGSVFTNVPTYNGGYPSLLFSGEEGVDLLFRNNVLEFADAGATGEFGGGAVNISMARTTFENFNKLEFSGNVANNTQLLKADGSGTSEAVGGGLYATLLSLKNIKELVFSGNKVSAERYAGGGALSVAGDPAEATVRMSVMADGIGEITFDGNQALVRAVTGNARGGALYVLAAGADFETFIRCGKITFSNNRASYAEGTLSGTPGNSSQYFEGGAIFGGNFKFQDTGSVLFLNNSADARRAPAGQKTTVSGGAIDSGSLICNGLFVLPGEQYALHFSGNSALSNSPLIFGGVYPVGGAGGAVFTPMLRLFNSEEMLFENNFTTGWGGAVYIAQVGGYEIDHANRRSYGQNIYADKGDITFRGNTHLLKDSSDRTSGTLNSIYFEGTSANNTGTSNNNMQVLISAAEGHAVNFYDPIASYNRAAGKLPIFFNYYKLKDADGNLLPRTYTGTIRFSGKYVNETLKQMAGESNDDFAARIESSKRSDINASVQLYDGTLMLEEGVTLGRKFDAANADKGEGMTYSQWGGTLDISNSTLAASDVYMAGSAAGYKYGNGATIKAGGNARLESSGEIDWSGGINIDLGYHLTENGFAPQPGLSISSATMTLDGPLSIADKGGKLEYYENARWKNAHTFILADITEVGTLTGDLSGIHSQLSGSDIVKGFGYNGTWTYENKSGQLLATWTPDYIPTPEPEPETPEPEKSVHPELAGNLILNSLWSTTSNMRAFTRTALGQMDAPRFLLRKNTNYWALGLGDFSSHTNSKGIEGYDYNGFGYAVGSDTKLADNLIAGLAFGNLYGKNKSRNYNAHIDQTSYMGLAYASWFKDMDQTNSLVLNGTASYGLTSNKMDTRYSDGDRARGKWDNNALRLALRGEWNHVLNEQWILTPFLGLEYDHAIQKTFTETGDKARNFQKATLSNCALPVGVGISHTTSLANGRKWMHSLALSYIPDIYRKNPKSEALRTTNDFAWTAEGLRPERHAGRVDYNTRLILNETWSLFGGYALEGRKNALYHNANLGASASF